MMKTAVARCALLACVVGTWLAAPASAQQPPADPVELVKEARKLNAAGKQDEAIALYERALKLDPKSFDAQLGIGIALDLKGDFARARSSLQRAIDVAPAGALPQALSAMGVSYAFEAKAGEAAKFYERQFDLQMKAGALDSAAATANALARVYLESGDLGNAERWYTRGYEVARQLKDIPPDQVDLWELRYRHAQSRIAARRGDVAEAERIAADVKRIVDKGGANEEQRPVYQYLVGYVAFYAKRYDAAIAELAKADQRDPFILALIAQAYEAKGDRAQARRYYEQVLGSNAHSIQNAFSRPLAQRKLAS
jgi:tetratricopeptide (TPR) repeat protein